MKVVYLMDLIVKIELKGSDKIIKSIFDRDVLSIDFNYIDDELHLDHDYDAFRVIKIDQTKDLTEVTLRAEMRLYYIKEPIPEEKVREEIEKLHQDLHATRTIGFWSSENDCNPCFPYEITGYHIVKYINKPEEEEEEEKMKQEDLKALVILQDEKEVIFILSDGGIASSHYNEEHIVVDLYQDRLGAEISSVAEIWELLGEGKGYYQDFEKYDKVNKEIIEYTLDWLCMGFMGKKRDQTDLRIIKEEDEEKIPKIINDFVFRGKYPKYKNYDINEMEAIEYRKVSKVLAVILNDQGEMEEILLETGKNNPNTSIISAGGKIGDINISNNDESIQISKGKSLLTYNIDDKIPYYIKKGNKYSAAKEKMKIFAFYPDYIETNIITLGDFTNSIQQQCTVIEGDLIAAQRDYAAKVGERKKLESQKKGKEKLKKKMTKSLLRYLDDGKTKQVWLGKANEIDQLDGQIGDMQENITSKKIEEKNALKKVKELKKKQKQCATFQAEKQKTEKKLGSIDWVKNVRDETEDIKTIDLTKAGFDMDSMQMVNVVQSQDWKILSGDRESSIKINFRSKRVDFAIIHTLNRIDDYYYGCLYKGKEWTFFKLKKVGLDDLISFKTLIDDSDDWSEKIGKDNEKTEIASDWELNLKESLKNDLTKQFKIKNNIFTFPGKKALTQSSNFDIQITHAINNYKK